MKKCQGKDCNKELGLRQFKFCSDKCRIQSYKGKYKSTTGTLKSKIKKTLCICPRCGEKHYLELFWTGNGIPRKYHPTCRRKLFGNNDGRETDYSQAEE